MHKGAEEAKNSIDNPGNANDLYRESSHGKKELLMQLDGLHTQTFKVTFVTAVLSSTSFPFFLFSKLFLSLFVFFLTLL